MPVLLAQPQAPARINCDRCPAEAKARATSGASELFFCGHHTFKLLPGLIAEQWCVSAYPSSLDA